MRIRRSPFWFTSIIVMTFLMDFSMPGIVWAQFPQPRLNSLSRAGVRAGESAQVTLRGSDLEGAKQLWFDDPRVIATYVKDATFRVVAAPDVPLGHHDIRAIGMYGVTNPRTFVIGDRPETVEVEPNDVADKATEVVLGTVVNGEIGTPTDVDLFSFRGRRGQRLILDLDGARIESRLDATARVIDPKGGELVESRDAFGVDPFLDVRLPEDGRYLIKIHDAIFGGSPDHIYRLTISDGPHLDAIMPLAAEPGSSARFSLDGRGLGAGGSLDSKLKSDGVTLERAIVAINIPTTVEDWSNRETRVPFGFPSAVAGVRPGFGYRFVRDSQGGAMPLVSNRYLIALAEGTIILEAEPNNDPALAQRVEPACDISGTFGSARDIDLYQFKARKDDIWWIEAFAERIGSQADPSFVIQKVETDGITARDVASADDLADLGLGPRFNVESVDAALRWRVPEDATYRVAITDVYGSRRGQPGLVYRLVIRKERPDFQVVLVPGSSANPEALSLHAGGKGVAYALAIRKEGFAGSIRVEPKSLPPGVSAKPVTIAAGQALAPVVFEADENAKAVTGVAKLVGVSPVEASSPIVRPVLAGGMIWAPPSATTEPAVAAARVFSDFTLSVLGDPAPLALEAKPESVSVSQGHRIEFDLKIRRRAGFVDAVTVTATDLPATVAPATVTVAKDVSNAVLSLFVPKNAAPGTYTILARGSGNVPFSKDPGLKNKPNIVISTPSNPISLTVLVAPFQLTVQTNGGVLKVGQSTNLDVVLSRQNGFKGAVSLALSAPGSLRLVAKPYTIAENQTHARLLIEADKQSPIGAAAGVYVQAAGTVNGSAVVIEEPFTLTIEK